MPRPLPQISKISDGVGWPLERRIELAACIGRIATFWSRIEERLGLLLSQLLGAEPRIGMAMFRSLGSTADRMSILRATAHERLDKDTRERLDELLERFDLVRGKRDRIICGHWYVCDEYSDALVCAEPEDELSGASDFWSGYHGAVDFGDQMKFARDYAPPRPNYVLFEKSDFEQILEEMRTLGFALTDFLIEVSEITSQPAPAEG